MALLNPRTRRGVIGAAVISASIAALLTAQKPLLIWTIVGWGAGILVGILFVISALRTPRRR